MCTHMCMKRWQRLHIFHISCPSYSLWLSIIHAHAIWNPNWWQQFCIINFNRSQILRFIINFLDKRSKHEIIARLNHRFITNSSNNSACFAKYLIDCHCWLPIIKWMTKVFLNTMHSNPSKHEMLGEINHINNIKKIHRIARDRGLDLLPFVTKFILLTNFHVTFVCSVCSAAWWFIFTKDYNILMRSDMSNASNALHFNKKLNQWKCVFKDLFRLKAHNVQKHKMY